MKKVISILLVLCSLVLLSGCQSKVSQELEKVKNIKITVDQNTVNQTNQGIQNYQNGN